MDEVGACNREGWGRWSTEEPGPGQQPVSSGHFFHGDIRMAGFLTSQENMGFLKK